MKWYTNPDYSKCVLLLKGKMNRKESWWQTHTASLTSQLTVLIRLDPAPAPNTKAPGKLQAVAMSAMLYRWRENNKIETKHSIGNSSSDNDGSTSSNSSSSSTSNSSSSSQSVVITTLQHYMYTLWIYCPSTSEYWGNTGWYMPSRLRRSGMHQSRYCLYTSKYEVQWNMYWLIQKWLI